MSDYLSNLIARNISQTGGIQPRLMSRFEPPLRLEEPFDEQFLELEPEDSAVASPKISPGSPRQSFNSSLQVQPSTVALNPLPSSSQPMGEEHGVPPLSERPPLPHLMGQGLVMEQANISLEPSSAANPKVEIHSVSTEILPRQSSPIIRPQIVPLPESTALPAPIANPEPPTIQITIGRIDVRAIAPSSSPPRQSPKPPTPNLSLQDYLRSGKGDRS